MRGVREELVAIYYREQKRELSKCAAVGQDICISVFEGLSLEEYVDVRSSVCSTTHKQPCKNCCGLLQVANEVLQKGFLKLRSAFEMAYPDATYKSWHARRRMLQMPLASLGIGNRSRGSYSIFLVEKQDRVKYPIMQTLLNQWIKCETAEPSLPLTKETMNSLLQIAESDAERKRLKYAVVRATGLSNTKAKEKYGFSDIGTTLSQVEQTLDEVSAIHEAIEKIAQVKDKVLLKSLGVPMEMEGESSDESESDDDDGAGADDEDGHGCGNNDGDSDGGGNDVDGDCGGGGEGDHAISSQVSSGDVESAQNLTCTQVDGRHQFQLTDEQYKHISDTGECYMNTHQLLDILRKCNLNWLEFVCALEVLMPNAAEHVLEQVLLDFAGQLPFLDLSEHDERIIEQSRQVYLEEKRRQEMESEIADGMIVSDSDSDCAEEWQRVRDPLDEAGLDIIKKKRAAIRRKATREVKKRVAERRYLRRRKSKKVGRIQREHPDIGETIEQYVQKCGVGADAWRRTGVLTFDGNKCVGRKVTFKRIQEHLQAKYKSSFSYGSVVQLCVARNKRRKSAARYKGLAQVVQRRARKGFTLKYNPDAHWSSALYAGFDKLQYTNGNNIMNLGRDDQAGFRLDSMTTHKQHGTLCLKNEVPLTTRTDYVNRYPSVLQTTSYNFPATDTTEEICAGVVKAQPLHCKNPAQHFEDLLMVEDKPEVKPAFHNHQTGKLKEIECARVDGGADEGPIHKEVQYWWTKRHLQKGHKATLISTRNSGASYRNRVELQNGCLALGHANLFIPSTLYGSCLENGKVNSDILCKNLSSAIDVYLSRVNQSPCAGTVIHLWKGPDSKDTQTERAAVLTYLKGKKNEKEQLRKSHPDLYKSIHEIWTLRNSHMVPNLPSQYLFYLRCCYNPQCIHPVCKTTQLEDIPWFPGGPSISFLPIPTPDPTRPFGNDACTECSGFCAGHYMKLNELLDYVNSGNNLPKAKPPSEILLEAHKKWKGIPDNSAVLAIAKEALLPPEEVRLWLKHSEDVACNRKRGAKKAAAKRRERQTNLRQRTDASNVCHTCNSEEPPLAEDDNDEDDEQMIDWVACNSCTQWHHIACVEIESISKWTCTSCK